MDSGDTLLHAYIGVLILLHSIFRKRHTQEQGVLYVAPHGLNQFLSPLNSLNLVSFFWFTLFSSAKCLPRLVHMTPESHSPTYPPLP